MRWLLGSAMLHEIKRPLATMTAAEAASFASWPSQFDNTLLQDLRAEPADRNPYQSRQVMGAHYTRLRPNVKAPRPALVAYSPELAAELGIDPADCEGEEFMRFFAGGPPKDVECWATAYGASFTGRYGGQRGDGRAISIGQVRGQEVQLKGAGVTPFSRTADGRAVLRSSVREFLGQECMHALGVPTSRSLCLFETGEEVVRMWYDDDGRQAIAREKGAVGTRVATSFLRFGQMELFAQTGQIELLRELAAHALDREYASLRETNGEKGGGATAVGAEDEGEGRPNANAAALNADLLLRFFDAVCQRHARLVAEWMRVGYCQGNMNSDNSALGGVTLDYGPFAFMERFAPFYNPWYGARGRSILHATPATHLYDPARYQPPICMTLHATPATRLYDPARSSHPFVCPPAATYPTARSLAIAPWSPTQGRRRQGVLV